MNTIRRREISGYFHTAAGYVFIGVFLAVSSVLFYMQILRQRSGDLPRFIAEMSYLWMLLSPVLTMRLLAEEKQKKTDQLLLTSPVSLPGIVIGKYLAAVTVLLATAGMTLMYVLVVAIYGTVYPAELAVNYTGFILQGCAFAALDLYISGCASTPVTAAAAAFGANFLLWILDLLENAVQVSWLSDALRFLSLYRRNEPFMMGQFTFAGLLYDLSFIAVFLALTVYHMDRKRAGARSIRYGSVSALMTALILAGMTVLNVGAQALERRKGWKIDLSFNSITSQSPETEKVLAQADSPVHIWALYRKGSEDAPLMELLDRYAAASPLVTWEQADPALNPALVSRFTTAAGTPGTDSLIVYCEKTGRFRILGPEDFVAVGMDETTGEYTYTGWTYERSITGAISYVTRERIPQAVVLQGHGEMDRETLKEFETLLTDNQYEVRWAELDELGGEISPEDLLIFFSPLRDLTETELERLTAYAGKGGSFLFTCDYTDPASEMPRYAALLRSYGFAPREGIVIADAADEDSYYNGNPVWLLPEMCSTDLTIDLIASGYNHLLLPGSRAFEEPEEGDRNLTAAAVLRSGETAYLKALDSGTVSMEQEAKDPAGAFPLALEARRVTTEGYVSRAFIMGCAAAMADGQLYAMTDSRQLVIRVMEFLLKLDASDLSIMPRQAVRPGLSTAGTGLGSLIVVALPLVVLAAAILVLGPRRNR